MTSTNKRNLSALRASLKHEDAALENRLPAANTLARVEASTTPAAATAPDAGTAPTAAARSGAKPAARRAAGPSGSRPAAPAAKPAGATVAAAKPVAKAAAKTVAKPAAPKPVKTGAAAVAGKPAAKPRATPRPAATAKPSSAPAAGFDQTMPAKADRPRQTTQTVKNTASKSAGKKAKADKLVKDTFEMPRSERAQLKSLRAALAAKGVECTKSGLLRAGLAALLRLDGAALSAVAQAFAKPPKARGGKKA